MVKGVFDDEASPRPRVAHSLGESLDDLSVSELEERITHLRAEIERLEAAKRAKRTASEHAGSIFKS